MITNTDNNDDKDSDKRPLLTIMMMKTMMIMITAMVIRVKPSSVFTLILERGDVNMNILIIRYTSTLYRDKMDVHFLFTACHK